MPSEADGRPTYSWTTFRYLVNSQREIIVPMGVILWSEPEHGCGSGCLSMEPVPLDP